MIDAGLLVVDKPEGMTSHDVVARIRRAAGTRKVGHAGTLDPMATGVLVVGVERATRLLGHLALADKRYLATIRLGATTVTDDREGASLVTASRAALAAVSDEAIRAGIVALTGDIRQRPSAVSAIKVAGRRSYDRVRAGEDIVLAERPVHVARFDALAIRRQPRDGDPEGNIDVDVDVECSTGTFVRALARDLGEALGVGGHLTALRRTRVGGFADPVPLAEAQADPAGHLVPLDEVAAAAFPTWRVDSPAARAVAFGQRIAWAGPPSAAGPVAVLSPEGRLLALAVDDGGLARYLAVFACQGDRHAQ
ncbi:MAG: tRNA pseudouridine(55) synthase TruB [Candidatus Nanopelagicales bacterium]